MNEAINQLIAKGAQEISTSGERIFVDYGEGERDTGMSISYVDIERMARLAASKANKFINRRKGFLNLSLDNGARFSALLPPGAKVPSLSIRIHDFRQRSILEYMTADQAEQMRAAFLAWRNIIIAGATFSGKTTFLRAFLRECATQLAPHDRYYVVEDAPELQVDFDNAVYALAAREEDDNEASFEEHVFHALRMRPDRLVIGEVRGREARELIRAWATGHSGLSTVHAESAHDVIKRFEDLEAGTRGRIESAIGMGVYIERAKDGRRYVKAIVVACGGRRFCCSSYEMLRR